MLFYSVFHPFHRKNDSSVILKSLNPEGSYLCDVTLPALIIKCQFLLWNKENKQDFLLGDKKNLNFLLFSGLRSIFLVPVFLCSFIIPFTENSVIFIKSIFNILLFLIVDLHHTFW